MAEARKTSVVVVPEVKAVPEVREEGVVLELTLDEASLHRSLFFNCVHGCGPSFDAFLGISEALYRAGICSRFSSHFVNGRSSIDCTAKFGSLGD